MRISLRVLLVLVSGVLGGCVHTWAGSVPPICQPSSDPLTLPPQIVENGRLATGTLFIQVIADELPERTPSFAFLIYIKNMPKVPDEWTLKDSPAYLTHIIGPIKTDEEWRDFSDSLRAFASTRPGGFFCDKPDSKCSKNNLAALADGEGQQLAWGPKPPSPPPPESFGVIQHTQSVAPSAVGGWVAVAPAQKNAALYASRSNLPADPGSCRSFAPTEEHKKDLGSYVYRALETRGASYSPHPYPYSTPPASTGGPPR
jgi:hypothetical protein